MAKDIIVFSSVLQWAAGWSYRQIEVTGIHPPVVLVSTTLQQSWPLLLGRSNKRKLINHHTTLALLWSLWRGRLVSCPLNSPVKHYNVPFYWCSQAGRIKVAWDGSSETYFARSVCSFFGTCWIITKWLPFALIFLNSYQFRRLCGALILSLSSNEDLDIMWRGGIVHNLCVKGILVLVCELLNKH